MEAQAESPFGTRVVASLVGAGLLLALGFLLLSGFGSDIERSFGREPPARSRAGDGFYGLFKLIDDVPDGMASIASRPADFGGGDLLILTPEPDTKRVEIDAILARRREAGHPTLIVLPKWQVEAIPLSRDRVRTVGWASMPDLYRMVPLDDFSISRGQSTSLRIAQGYAGAPFPSTNRQSQSITSDALAPLVSGQNGGIVLGRIGDSETYILADPDLIDNQALKSKDGAFAALSMMGALKPEAPGLVSFDTTLHYRPGDRNLIKLMFTPPFLAVTVALFAAALLAGWASLLRFGPVRREGRAIALGKTPLVDNVAALTRLAGKTRSSGDRYADGMREWAARRLRAPRGLKGHDLSTFIEATTPTTSHKFSELEAAARAADTESEMLRAAQQLNDWRKELTA